MGIILEFYRLHIWNHGKSENQDKKNQIPRKIPMRQIQKSKENMLPNASVIELWIIFLELWYFLNLCHKLHINMINARGQGNLLVLRTKLAFWKISFGFIYSMWTLVLCLLLLVEIAHQPKNHHFWPSWGKGRVFTLAGNSKQKAGKSMWKTVVQSLYTRRQRWGTPQRWATEEVGPEMVPATGSRAPRLRWREEESRWIPEDSWVEGMSPQPRETEWFQLVEASVQEESGTERMPAAGRGPASTRRGLEVRSTWRRTGSDQVIRCKRKSTCPHLAGGHHRAHRTLERGLMVFASVRVKELALDRILLLTEEF